MTTFQLHHQTLVTIERQNTHQDDSNESQLDEVVSFHCEVPMATFQLLHQNHIIRSAPGSTTDLTPTLIGIYDSLLEPAKSLRPEEKVLETAKDARNDPPVYMQQTKGIMTKETQKPNDLDPSRMIDPSRIAGSVKLPIATLNKSSLYSIRTTSDKNGASDENDKCELTSETVLKEKYQRTLRDSKVSDSAFDNLSPNVKRMISGATETTGLKFKKTATIGRASMRHKTNIPLVGATSKISQSGVEILPSVEIYDQPCGLKTFGKSKVDNNNESSSKAVPVKPDFKLDEEQTTYDVPTNNRPVLYDVPHSINKTAFESLSLPYIDQSIELSITANDREFDIKLSSKENSPQKPERKKINEEVPAKIPKTVNGRTNSLHRKDFVNRIDAKTLLKSEAYPETVGSTGNLKSCAIVEKDVSRLNPPTLEVTRPLSMSSIASSSSTSSSGIQNKGGVNSAYLASIESLDDHSDADMTSANGSNNFVNDAGILNTSVSEEHRLEDLSGQQDPTSGLSQLERVCAEIVQTESVYVEDLRQVVEGYLHEWRKEATFSEEELSELFNNIEDIYAFNRSLCAELNTCRLDATCIARCFVDNTTGFSVYTSYCTGYPRTMERLAALASVAQSAREFRERQLALGHPLPLASYLLKPVQRILKYHLLLQNVVKQCASRDTEYALLKMTGIAQHIDDMKRRHEHAVRVQEIQSLLYGWNGPDLTTYGELCAEGTFRVFGAKAMRHAFLFDKLLLITKNREDGILAYKSHIMCNNMMLVESISGAPLSFHVIPWDAPRAQLTLQARSPRHKREWTLLLKRVILENYNAVIPSHARQLVMELGQNKTDDDMLAEKSHNLITQASMRKQLSAPEYLEKRKLERERRKCFENSIRGRFKKGNRKYTMPMSRNEVQDCDCAQVSAEKGTDFTCDSCYIDLCSDCETELNKDKKDCKYDCAHDDHETGSKCPDCDKRLQYIDAGSIEHLERKSSDCKCSDFNSSQESFSKEFTNTLNKTRGYHSSDNIVSYTINNKSKDDVSDNLVTVRNLPKTCLKCSKIKENIVFTDSSSTIHSRKSRCNDGEKSRTDTLRSKSKDDPNRSKLSKIGTWRRKSEPGLQQNCTNTIKKSQDSSDFEKHEVKGSEKIEFECRNCGTNKINKKANSNHVLVTPDLEVDGKRNDITSSKPNLEVRMYNTKHIPKKISKIKKNRARGLRLGSDTTAKFYADFSTDVSTENILHITESNDSLNIDQATNNKLNALIPETISKDEDIDEETYKKLIEKTDSFKKNELEKVKYLNKQKVINEGSESEEKNQIETRHKDVTESCDESEQPLEQIISQLLMQNREFQKLLKKQQLRNSAQRRHQRLLKSHSNPEQVIVARNSELSKLKPKCARQMSENFDNLNDEKTTNLNTQVSLDLSDDDHIYETLRVDSRIDESLHSLDAKSKSIQHNSHTSRPKRIPSPPLNAQSTLKNSALESDYVYLSFDQIRNEQDADAIYDVPSKFPKKVKDLSKGNDYYVTMENKGPPTEGTNVENLYDNLIEVCRRQKEVSNTLPDDYLPMSSELQSPNTPEIWLSRQKEHFNVSRDRKSGSLPRSFQVPIASSPEEANLSSFKNKPNSNSKTYLNRDGKVMSSDRPFTIASDKSEISYDDVENYMSEGDILKFSKNSNANETEYVQNISQSTLELEEEIDRCYKNNFEKVNLDTNKNESQLNASQQNLNTSTTSSCEVLPIKQDDEKPKDIEIIHPEHKIYKPASNILSLKNVLNRFKNRTPSKNAEENEVNANENSPDGKSDLKSPPTEKRAALNPRNYSKNLLQRFRSIISDEHPDDNHNKSGSPGQTKLLDDVKNIMNFNESEDSSSNASPKKSQLEEQLTNDALSKSVSEQATLGEVENEKNNLESLSQSCDGLPQSPEVFRPDYVTSVSLSTSSTAGSITPPIKSTNSSYQNLIKMPIYMQGSKYLGARIAQSDYVDPATLVSEKSMLKKVNVLINKNSVRPDSLFSNSSFNTSSSEGTSNENQNKSTEIKDSATINENNQTKQSDDSYYEKSFEKIEQLKDGDVFRDSAVYSDQDESEDTKSELVKNKFNSKLTSVSRSSSIKQSISNFQKITVKSTVCEKVSVKTNRSSVDNNVETNKHIVGMTKAKIAPPVPLKPKMTNMSKIQTFQNKGIVTKMNMTKTEQQPSLSESLNTIINKRNSSNLHKQPYVRSESSPSSPTENQSKSIVNATKTEMNRNNDPKVDDNNDVIDKLKPQGNIQMKRLSFERASLDSATRKTKMLDKRLSTETQKTTTSKSVLERRMELEQLTKTQIKPNSLKKPTQIARPKSITMKVATFERSVSENGRPELKTTPGCSNDKTNIPPMNSISVMKLDERVETNDVDSKSSWVKQVVNKFQ